MDRDKYEQGKPLLPASSMKRIETVPKMSSKPGRRLSENKKLNYVEFATSDKDGSSHSNSQLDLEMEKVFKDDKFDLAKITSSASLTNQKFDCNEYSAQHVRRINEEDYDQHRKAHHFHHTPSKTSRTSIVSMKPSGDSSSSSGNNSISNNIQNSAQQVTIPATAANTALETVGDPGKTPTADTGGADKLFELVANNNDTGSSNTPLSTAPTSPISQSSHSSYKSGAACDYDATTPTAVYVGEGGVDGVFVLQIPDTVSGGNGITEQVVLTPTADDEPQLSERAAYGEQVEMQESSKKVQFNRNSAEKEVKPKEKRFVIGSFPSAEDDGEFGDTGQTAGDNERRRRRSRHMHKNRKYSLQENSNSFDAPPRKVSIQPEDATLEEADLDDLTSHRSEDQRGLRRTRVSMAAVQKEPGSNNVPLSPGGHKKQFDHSVHEIFVQLDELTGVGEEREWKETARWIKYEEDVEEGADRWGRPHVASLSFHSLLNLRKCLETGVVLLDLEEKDLPGIAYRVVEQMVIDELIQEDDKPTLLRALLLRHRHVNEHGGFNFGLKKKYSSYSSLTSIRTDCVAEVNGVKRECSFNVTQNNNETSPSIEMVTRSQRASTVTNVSPDSRKLSLMGDRKVSQASDLFNWKGGSSHPDTKIDIKEETYMSSQEDIKRLQSDSIMKRIPRGAEATTVLVGAVDFLEQPTIAFVRLATGLYMPGITEVPIPVRFLFILLGPKMVDIDYHEVGRSISTLMSNSHFHEIAYKAEDRRELLSAINEFLDESIVLPPGKWEKKNLLAFDELREKSEMIRTRKKKAIEEKKKHILTTEEEKKLLEKESKEPPIDPLKKTGRWWGGLINDAKRRFPMYKSDIVDGFNSETLAATIFMYFACISTAITFGGLASEKTGNLIGISETLISASFVGILFHSLAGQPLVIVGTTGPLLLFDEALRNFCDENNFDFLTVRVFIGIWLTVISITFAAFEFSVYVRFFTRFTQEIFSALITIIYIVETVSKLFLIFSRHPLLETYEYKRPEENGSSYLDVVKNMTTPADLLDPIDEKGRKINQPNTALFCTILTLGTFALAYYLKLFRNSHFFGRNARRALGDFGVPISITCFVIVDFFTPEVYSEKLTVPTGVSPSDPERRGWLITPIFDQVWLPFAALIPSLLVFILIFMETHISELIVDKPERGLKKGSGLHMDIVLLCILNCVCGFFGMPWHCAATVRSVTHVSAVTIMSRTHAPGESPHIEEVKEQRVSGILVSIMVGLSVLMAKVLRLIPLSVLFGVFLYMGIASMSGVQFFERIRLFLMPVKHHPMTNYARRVPTWKMHVFTLLQMISLVVLWVVKSSRFSLAFPFLLLMMVPLRQKLDSFYTPQEMRALDGAQPKGDDEEEPDFYEQAPIPA